MILKKLRIFALTFAALSFTVSCGDVEEECNSEEETCEEDADNNNGDSDDGNSESNGTALASIDDFELGFTPDGVATEFDGTWNRESGCVEEEGTGWNSKLESVEIDSNSLIVKAQYYVSTDCTGDLIHWYIWSYETMKGTGEKLDLVGDRDAFFYGTSEQASDANALGAGGDTDWGEGDARMFDSDKLEYTIIKINGDNELCLGDDSASGSFGESDADRHTAYNENACYVKQ